MNAIDKIKAAKDTNGLLAEGKLNWLGNYNNELKCEQFSVFFNKATKARTAAITLQKYGKVEIIPTPKHVNSYFKYTVRILINPYKITP